ncbi:hypothetical protein LCGC14_1679660, partial [marine sediment metagenome]
TIEALRTSGKKELIPELESWLARVESDLVRAEGRGIVAPAADIGAGAGLAPTAEEISGLASIKAAAAADVSAVRARPLEAPLEADVFAERGVADVGARPAVDRPAEEGLISSQVLEPRPREGPAILSTRLPNVKTPLDNALAKLGGEAGGTALPEGLGKDISVLMQEAKVRPSPAKFPGVDIPPELTEYNVSEKIASIVSGGPRFQIEEELGGTHTLIGGLKAAEKLGLREGESIDLLAGRIWSERFNSHHVADMEFVNTGKVADVSRLKPLNNVNMEERMNLIRATGERDESLVKYLAESRELMVRGGKEPFRVKGVISAGEQADADLRAMGFRTKPAATSAQIRKWNKEIQRVTAESLDVRGLPDRFLVFRGGGISSEFPEGAVPVTLDPYVAEAFARSGFGRNADEPFQVYVVSRSDILADIEAIRGGTSAASGEAELLISRSALGNPIKLNPDQFFTPTERKAINKGIEALEDWTGRDEDIPDVAGAIHRYLDQRGGPFTGPGTFPGPEAGVEAGGGRPPIGASGLRAEREIRQEVGVVEKLGDENWIFADGAIVDISKGSRELPTARIDNVRGLLGERYGGYFHTDVSIRYLPPEDRAAFYGELDELAESPSDLLQFDWDARDRFGEFTRAISVQKRNDGALDIVTYGPLSPQQKVAVEQAVRDAKTVHIGPQQLHLTNEEAKEAGFKIGQVTIESKSPIDQKPLRNTYWALEDPSQIKDIPVWKGRKLSVSGGSVPRVQYTLPARDFSASISAGESPKAIEVTAANVRAKLDELGETGIGPGTFPGPVVEEGGTQLGGVGALMDAAKSRIFVKQPSFPAVGLPRELTSNQVAQKVSAILEGKLDSWDLVNVLGKPITAAQQRAWSQKIRVATEASLEKRNLPDTFLVFRGGDVHAKGHVNVTLSPYDAGGFAQERGGVFEAYVIKKSDVLADIEAIRFRTDWRARMDELLVTRESLQNPVRIDLTSYFSPEELGALNAARDVVYSRLGSGKSGGSMAEQIRVALKERGIGPGTFPG